MGFWEDLANSIKNFASKAGSLSGNAFVPYQSQGIRTTALKASGVTYLKADGSYATPTNKQQTQALKELVEAPVIMAGASMFPIAALEMGTGVLLGEVLKDMAIATAANEGVKYITNGDVNSVGEAIRNLVENTTGFEGFDNNTLLGSLGNDAYEFGSEMFTPGYKLLFGSVLRGTPGKSWASRMIDAENSNHLYVSPVRPSAIVDNKKVYGVQEGLKDKLIARAKELDTSSQAELAAMKPNLAKGLEEGNPTAILIRDNIAQIADGEVIFPTTLIATPEQGVIIPIVNELGYQPSVDLLITSTGLFPPKTFPNGNRSIPSLIYGVKGTGDAGKANLGLITLPKSGSPKKIKRGEHFIDTSNNSAVATYYTPYGNNSVTDAKIRKALADNDFFNSLSPEAQEIAILNLINYNNLALEAMIPKPAGASHMTSRGISSEYEDAFREIMNSIIDLTGGNLFGVNLLVSPYTPSWRLFNGKGRLFDDLSIGNVFSTGNTRSDNSVLIKNTNSLNKKVSSASPETEGYIILDIIDTPEFTPVMGNDILFNSFGKNWTYPIFKKGGKL